VHGSNQLLKYSLAISYTSKQLVQRRERFDFHCLDNGKPCLVSCALSLPTNVVLIISLLQLVFYLYLVFIFFFRIPVMVVLLQSLGIILPVI